MPVRCTRPIVLTVALAAGLVAAAQRPAAGQRPYFVTPPPGAGPTPMRPYGEFAGCPEEPVAFHACARRRAAAFVPRRTAGGVPDLQGYWTRMVARNQENIEEHPEGMDGSGGRSLVIDPADGRIPFQPWAAARVERQYETYVDPARECMPDAPPKHVYAADSREIVQTPGQVVMLNDFSHTYRVIPTDGRAHLSAGLRLRMGDSRGRWDGTTLVVEVKNLRDRVWIDHVGHFYSDTVRVVERWTMFHADGIHYQATLDDPRVFTRPWTMVAGWRRNPDPAFEMIENACWEGVSRGPASQFRHTLRRYPGAFDQ